MPTKMPTKASADTPTELIEFLPGWVADFVDETADELQVPTNAVALLSIGAAAAAVNGGANTCPTGTWAEPVVLYTLALLASGEGKSPVFSRLIDPVIEASMEVCDAQAGRRARSEGAQPDGEEAPALVRNRSDAQGPRWRNQPGRGHRWPSPPKSG